MRYSLIGIHVFQWNWPEWHSVRNDIGMHTLQGSICISPSIRTVTIIICVTSANIRMCPRHNYLFPIRIGRCLSQPLIDRCQREKISMLIGRCNMKYTLSRIRNAQFVTRIYVITT